MKLWWNMKVRLCDLKMRLIYLILQLDLRYFDMHAWWKFDEASLKLKELWGLQLKLWWNMKMRLCDLKMRLVYLIFEIDLKCCDIHLKRWKFDETNSKMDRVNVFTMKIMINYENEAMWSENEADLSHLQTWPQTSWHATMIKIWCS